MFYFLYAWLDIYCLTKLIMQADTSHSYKIKNNAKINFKAMLFLKGKCQNDQIVWCGIPVGKRLKGY